MHHRTVDLVRDRDFLLDVHCELNFVCESEVDRRTPYEVYRRQWLNSGQPEDFLAGVAKSLEDPRTLCEVIEDEVGEPIAYLWLTFVDVHGYDMMLAELNDLWVAPHRRRQGMGRSLIEFSAAHARSKGAHRLRSGSGAGNSPALRLHADAGFLPYRVELERPL